MHPYLSIVVASRNDAHGGNMLKRMRLFVDGLIKQCNRFNMPVELVVVEWNPPDGSPLLKDVLPRPGSSDKLTLRYIQVPACVHNRYRRAKEIPLFQMIAKNVGIRRARGEFILCTNVDILFSDAVFAVFAQRNFRKDTYYRANRLDVPDGIDDAWDLDQQLDWCSKNVLTRLGRDMRFRHINLEQFGLNEKSFFKKWLFDKMAIGMTFFWPPEKKAYYQIDSFACGDFTLMARDAWLHIKGYLELDFYSIHIDTLGLIFARALGYQQHVFPRHVCTYHVHHSHGWGSMNPLEKMNFLVERPGVDYGLVFDTGIYALKEKGHFNTNPENWGYSDLHFEEQVFP